MLLYYEDHVLELHQEKQEQSLAPAEPLAPKNLSVSCPVIGDH